MRNRFHHASPSKREGSRDLLFQLTTIIDRSNSFLRLFPTRPFFPEKIMTEGAESKMSAESRTLVSQKSPIRPVHPGKELLDDGRDTIHRRIDICIYIYIWDDGSRRLKQRKRERVPDVDLRLLTVKKQSKYIYIPGKGLLRSCDRRGSWPANIDLLRPRFLPIAVPFLILL